VLSAVTFCLCSYILLWLQIIFAARRLICTPMNLLGVAKTPGGA